MTKIFSRQKFPVIWYYYDTACIRLQSPTCIYLVLSQQQPSQPHPQAGPTFHLFNATTLRRWEVGPGDEATAFLD